MSLTNAPINKLPSASSYTRFEQRSRERVDEAQPLSPHIHNNTFRTASSISISRRSQSLAHPLRRLDVVMSPAQARTAAMWKEDAVRSYNSEDCRIKLRSIVRSYNFSCVPIMSQMRGPRGRRSHTITESGVEHLRTSSCLQSPFCQL